MSEGDILLVGRARGIYYQGDERGGQLYMGRVNILVVRLTAEAVGG